MGNVFIEYSPKKILKKYTSDEKLISLLSDTFYDSPTYRETDRGTLDFEGAINAFEGVLPPDALSLLRQIHLGRSYAALDMTRIPEMRPVVAALKEKGLGVYLLSNAGPDFHDYKASIPGLELMDGLFISCDCGYIKPEKEIYLLMLEKFNLQPQECVFFDDVSENVLAARECGINAVQYSSVKDGVPHLIGLLKQMNLL